MPVLESKLNPRSADFVANATAMRALVADLNGKVAQAAFGGGEAACEIPELIAVASAVNADERYQTVKDLQADIEALGEARELELLERTRQREAEDRDRDGVDVKILGDRGELSGRHQAAGPDHVATEDRHGPLAREVHGLASPAVESAGHGRPTGTPVTQHVEREQRAEEQCDSETGDALAGIAQTRSVLGSEIARNEITATAEARARRARLDVPEPVVMEGDGQRRRRDRSAGRHRCRAGCRSQGRSLAG